jgi:hypothetical protein
VTLDDASSELYSALLAEEGTVSTLQVACLEVFTKHGLPSSLYTGRGHYSLTAMPASGWAPVFCCDCSQPVMARTGGPI